MTFKRVKVEFNELVTTESATNIENYTIKSGSTELEIEKIVDVTESDDDYTTVEITTAAQKSGTKYELSAVNIVDQSVLANKMTKASKKSFTGKAEDKSAPVFASSVPFDYIARNKVIVNFSDASRLDKDSVLTLSNYSFNNDITIEKVEMLPGYEDEDDFYSVLLTTSEFGAKSSYQLTVVGIKDEYGNEMKEKKATRTYVKANAIASAQVIKAYATKATEVRIEFDKPVNALTAKDVANYSINKDIGTPLTAKADPDCYGVKLTVPELKAGTSYTITINGVQDLAGNTLVNVKPSFVALTTENDLDAPEIEDISALNNKVVSVRFSEPIDDAVANGAAITIRPYGGPTNGSQDVILTAKVTYEDDTVVEFSDSSATLADIEYIVVGAANIADKAGNTFVPDSDSYPSFYGVAENPEKLDFSWEQVSVNKFKLTFSENVTVKSTAPAAFGTTANTLLYKADDIDEEPNVYFLYSNSPIKVDKEFKDDINRIFESYHGVAINNLDGDIETILVASMEDEEAPYIVKVEAQYRDRIVVTYNEDLRSVGGYTVKYYDENGKEKTVSLSTPAFYDSTTFNKVKIDLASGVLDSSYSYTLKVVKAAVDLAGNKEEVNEEYSFEGTDLRQVGNYLTGVEVLNGTKMTVFAKSLSGVQTVDVVYGNNITVYTGTPTFSSNEATITLTTTNIANVDDPSETVNGVPVAAFADDVKYTVKVGSMSYEFKGIVESGVNVARNLSNFEISYSDMKVGDIIVVVGNGAANRTAHVLTQTDVDNNFWSTSAPGGLTEYDVLVIRGGLVMLYDRGVSFE